MSISEVFNIDNMEYMKTIPDKFFDLVIADPPYGIGASKMAYLTETNTTVKQKNGTRLKPRKTVFRKSEWDSAKPSQVYFNELKRISKNQIIFGINYMDWNGVNSGRIKWNKCVPEGLSFKKYEFAYCSCIDVERELILLHSGFNRAKSLSEPDKAEKDFRKIWPKIHPTEKPYLLYISLLKTYAKQGDKIFDPNMGSQSSRIAAYDMGFDYWGCELDKEYFDKGNQRFENFKKQLKLL